MVDVVRRQTLLSISLNSTALGKIEQYRPSLRNMSRLRSLGGCFDTATWSPNEFCQMPKSVNFQPEQTERAHKRDATISPLPSICLFAAWMPLGPCYDRQHFGLPFVGAENSSEAVVTSPALFVRVQGTERGVE